MCSIRWWSGLTADPEAARQALRRGWFLRLLRNRTQPRTARQRLQVLRSQRKNACAGFIALVAAAEGCVRRRSRRKTFTFECQALRRSRTQPRTTRQRLQVLRSQRTNACAGFIALVAAAEGCVAVARPFTPECQALRRSRFYDCCATGRSLALLVSDYRFCVHIVRAPTHDLSLLYQTWLRNQLAI